MKILLETERLILRQFTEDDADNLFELDSDPDVVRFTTNLGQPTEYRIIQTQILPNFFSYYEKYDHYGIWAAIEKSSQEFIGWFLFRLIGDASYFDPKLANANDIELGYRLQKAAWGKGYATEGSKALILKGFSELGIECILAVAFAINAPSIRVMEKAGLKLQARFVDKDYAQEVVLYMLKKDEFKLDKNYTNQAAVS
ncbi:GNAT family N-acetyltransferase [Cylindrospermum sp. FACHB-282]|uniref:GNAT family N-acetyltransferase n=1 Tax=Cylindrospermum sp. FACHB-282 TaxID=2692794 RepID=UPI001685DEE8|nr:GNAT family N-acetyltransferase [Cylindrospermum sp. FACHB-282]MBD2385749.1 GNAT family N-acetyltransferase [Cylindrospermum sp. FACHB-282]